MMEFHQMAVKKVLYRRGQNKRYLVKWVFGWNGQLEEAMKMYPDGQFLIFVRNPEEQLLSWFKLLGLLACELSGVNPLEIKEILESVKKENIKWYKKEIEIVGKTDPKRLLLINFEEFYKNIQQSTRKIYEHFGTEIVPGSDFDLFLKQQDIEQLSHKRTVTDSKYISRQEIKARFPDLPSILFGQSFTESRLKLTQQTEDPEGHEKNE